MAPLRAQIDYASIGRKVFPVQQLPPGATVLYEREPETQDQQVASTLKGIVEMLEDLSGWSYRNYGNTAEELL